MMCALFEPQMQKLSPEEYQKYWVNIQTTKDMCYSLNNINPKYQSIEMVKLIT
jgi:hypothetical protein